MTKQKTIKRMLVTSVLSLVLCMSMFIGTTFAWFSDTAASANNKIVAGNLQIQLLMYDGESYVDIGNRNNPIFGVDSVAQNENESTLWEPGKTQVAYLAVKNNGSLALKYKVDLNVQDISKSIYEVMQYAIAPGAEKNSVDEWNTSAGTDVRIGKQNISEEILLSPGETRYFALSIHMDAQADDKYQGGEVQFNLNVFATQATAEKDSFGEQYDAEAIYIDTNVNK